MRRSGAAAGRRLPATPDEQRFVWRNALEHVKQAAAVPCAFDIHANHGCFLVLQEVLKQVRAVQDHPVAETHHFTHLQPLAGTIEAEINGMRTTLRQKADVTGLTCRLLDMIADTNFWMIQPHAIWP